MATLLLTGATGHVGSALLPRLLADPEQRVLALVRARDGDHLAARRQQLLADIGADESDRLVLLRGDVSQPGLGLSAADRDRVLSQADSIMHSAASVRFDLPEQTAAQQNIDATRAVLELCTALAEAGRLVRYDHVSTCYVAGDRRGRVLETEIDEGQGFRNSYEWSKCQAEGLVRAAGGAGLPLCIHRPSIVVGDSRTGATRSFNVLYWPLKIYARGWWRTLPGDPEALVDLVPVDWLADAMLALHRDAGSLGRCVHLAQGDAALTIGQMMERVRDRTSGPPLRVVDQARYRRFVRPLLWPFFQTRRGERIRRGGDAYLPYCLANPLFDTTWRDHLLRGLAPPDPLAVLDTILAFALRTDFGGTPGC